MWKARSFIVLSSCAWLIVGCSAADGGLSVARTRQGITPKGETLSVAVDPLPDGISVGKSRVVADAAHDRFLVLTDDAGLGFAVSCDKEVSPVAVQGAVVCPQGKKSLTQVFVGAGVTDARSLEGRKILEIRAGSPRNEVCGRSADLTAPLRDFESAVHAKDDGGARAWFVVGDGAHAVKKELPRALFPFAHPTTIATPKGGAVSTKGYDAWWCPQTWCPPCDPDTDVCYACDPLPCYPPPQPGCTCLEGTGSCVSSDVWYDAYYPTTSCESDPSDPCSGWCTSEIIVY